MATADPQVKHWTRDEYYQMGEAGLFADQCVELIDGEILMMSPMKAAHAASVLLTSDALRKVFTAGYCVRVQLPLVLADDCEPEPNIAVVPGSPRDYTEHPTTALLIVEVSDTTLAFDRGRKRELYAQANVSEYWIVNLVDRFLEVFRDPVNGAFHHQSQFDSNDIVTPCGLHNAIQVADLLP